MEKTIFKDSKGNIHFGLNAPSEDFKKAEKKDIENTLSNLKDRKLWRCNVCRDLHIDTEPPEECPTCFVTDAYVEIDLNEFRKLIELL
ncbi:MAG: rubredoxin-like domain-containing protein [Nanoarchaeota archaeon]